MEQKPTTTTQWSTKSPGHLIFLIDQSHSMGEKYLENNNKAEFVAACINRCINELIYANRIGEYVKNRAFIEIITYGGQGGDSVEIYRKGMLSDFADHPLRMKMVKKIIADGDRGLAEIKMESAVFIEPVWCGCTAMGKAFDLTCEEIIKHRLDHVNIINTSDGGPWSYEREYKERDYAIEQAKRIMNLNISDGHPLLLNSHIGTGQPKLICPGPETNLCGWHPNFLRKISSQLTPDQTAIARKCGMDIVDNAYGFLSNADSVNFMNFISFGSSAPMNDRMSA